MQRSLMTNPVIFLKILVCAIPKRIHKETNFRPKHNTPEWQERPQAIQNLKDNNLQYFSYNYLAQR